MFHVMFVGVQICFLFGCRLEMSEKMLTHNLVSVLSAPASQCARYITGKRVNKSF